jgi:hypothetical protein
MFATSTKIYENKLRMSSKRVLVNVFLNQTMNSTKGCRNVGRPLKDTEVVFGNKRKNSSRLHAEEWLHKKQLGLEITALKCSLPRKSTGACLLQVQNS